MIDKLQLIQKAGFFLLVFFGFQYSAFGQYFSSAPTIDGTADAGYATSGSWSLGWDETYLYIRYSGGGATEPVIFHIDVDPQTPVSGGSNSNGSLTGQTNWGITPTLPFRSDFMIYWESQYAEYRTDNGSGGWSGNTVITTSDRSDNSSTDREIRLAWTLMGLSGRPSSFNWAGFANSRAVPGYIFNQLPSSNPSTALASPRLNYYFTVSNTASGSATNPFSRTSFEQRSGNGDIYISTIGSSVELYDLTNNAGNLVDEIILENNSGTVNVNVSGSVYLAGGITVNSFENLTMGSGSSTTISGNGYIAVNSGTLAYNQTASTLTYASGTTYGQSTEWPASNGPVTINVTGNTTVNLAQSRTINAAGSMNIAAGSGVTIASSQTLTTNGNLILSGSTSTPGRIGNSAGSVSGNVTIEVAIPGGRRAYRLIGNPFSSAQALSALIDDIHITGSGGASNGFDATGSNAPSAFSFSESGFNGSNNSGWTAYTSTSQTIPANGAARIFYRGPRSQGNLLDGSNPSPNSGTLDWSGTINNSSVGISLSYTAGDNGGWNLIPNPYPSNVNIGSIASGSRNSINTFAVWVPTNGTRGGYTSGSFGSTYIIPTGGAFFVQTASAGTFTFSQSDKTATTVSASLLKSDESKKNSFQIDVKSNDTIFWDQFVFKHNIDSKSEKDEFDAPKMQNPDVNFYSKSADGKKISIDNRSVSDNMVIPLSFETGSDYNFTFSVPAIDLPGMEVFLKDKYLNREIQVLEGMKYDFSTNSDAGSKGDGRFELLFKGSLTGVSKVSESNFFSVYPNPANDQISITLMNNISPKVPFKIINQLGMIVQEGNLDFSGDLNESLNIENLSQGVYFINLSTDLGLQTVKFIK